MLMLVNWNDFTNNSKHPWQC